MYRKLEEGRAAELPGDEETTSAAETECECACKESKEAGSPEAPGGVLAINQIKVDLDLNG